MRSLRPVVPDAPDVSLLVHRGGGRLSPAMFFGVRSNGEYLASFVLLVDGRPFRASGEGAHEAVLMLARATRLTVVGDGPTSLAGAADALRYMDREQERAGTVTAIVDVGNRDALTIPVHDREPQFTALQPDGEPRTVAPVMAMELRRMARCAADGPVVAQHFADGAALVLLPCGTDAGKHWSAALVVRNGRATPATVEQATPTDLPTVGGITRLADAEWKGGGLETGPAPGEASGCGVRRDYLWDGARLRLTHQEEGGACRGPADFITTWQRDWRSGPSP